MKLKLLFAALIIPFIVVAQQPDTVGVAAQVDSLNQVSYGLVSKSKYQEALAVSEAAEQLSIQKVGKESAEYARAHFYHAVVFHNMNKYLESETCLLETKRLQESLIGTEHPDYATTLYQLGTNYYYRGDLRTALAYMSESHQIRQKVLPKDNERYGESLYFLGFLLRKTGNPDAAEPLLLEYIAFNERKYGKAHFEYGRSLSDLGLLYGNDKGEYQKAESYQLEALSILEKAVGKSNNTYALTLNYLGTVYMRTSAYEKAEVLFLEALDIQKRNKVRARQIAITLDNLAQVYIITGSYDKAERYVLEAQDLFEKVIGIENPNYINSLRSLVEILLSKGEYVKAEQYSNKILERQEKMAGKENLEYAILLDNNAMVYLAMKDYGKAEAVLKESLLLYEQLNLQDNPNYAIPLLALGKLYVEMGDYDQAESLILNAKVIIEKVGGKEFHNYAEALNALSELYWRQKKTDLARVALLEGLECRRNTLIKGTQHLSERELAAYKQKFSANLDLVFSFAQAQGTVSSACFDNVLFQKGFLLYTVSQITKAASSSPVSAEKHHQLQSFRRRLATEYSVPFAMRDSAKIVVLEEKANALEKELVRTVSAYAQASRQVRWQDVQAMLKPGEAALEFIDYSYAAPNLTDSIMYAALVVRPGDTQPLFIPLFEKNELLPYLRGATGGNNFLKINALYTAKTSVAENKTPYELIWKPLEQALKNTSTIYCAASGLLHYINLAAIPAADGKPFGDGRHLVLLGSTRNLAMPNTSDLNSKEAFLAGGIRYEIDSAVVFIANHNLVSRAASLPDFPLFQPDSSAIRGGTLDYLPATAVEVREIGKVLTDAEFSCKIDTGFYATEEDIRSLGTSTLSPRILHLATHGYFFPNQKGKKGIGNTVDEPVFKMSEHPMIRSGLLMAGAKQAWLTGKHPEGKEDGILTAYEISQMNLSNTELVVLSACETGLGQIAGNEGVYGLQRAFKIAGAKYLIMSLWKVDDRSTKAFMTEFYKQWLQDKKTIPQAFQGAQQVMRTKYPSPYDWAGFVLIE